MSEWKTATEIAKEYGITRSILYAKLGALSDNVKLGLLKKQGHNLMVCEKAFIHALMNGIISIKTFDFKKAEQALLAFSPEEEEIPAAKKAWYKQPKTYFGAIAGLAVIKLLTSIFGFMKEVVD